MLLSGPKELAPARACPMRGGWQARMSRRQSRRRRRRRARGGRRRAIRLTPAFTRVYVEGGAEMEVLGGFYV